MIDDKKRETKAAASADTMRAQRDFMQQQAYDKSYKGMQQNSFDNLFKQQQNMYDKQFYNSKSSKSHSNSDEYEPSQSSYGSRPQSHTTSGNKKGMGFSWDEDEDIGRQPPKHKASDTLDLLTAFHPTLTSNCSP